MGEAKARREAERRQAESPTVAAYRPGFEILAFRLYEVPGLSPREFVRHLSAEVRCPAVLRRPRPAPRPLPDPDALADGRVHLFSADDGEALGAYEAGDLPSDLVRDASDPSRLVRWTGPEVSIEASLAAGFGRPAGEALRGMIRVDAGGRPLGSATAPIASQLARTLVALHKEHMRHVDVCSLLVHGLEGDPDATAEAARYGRLLEDLEAGEEEELEWWSRWGLARTLVVDEEGRRRAGALGRLAHAMRIELDGLAGREEAELPCGMTWDALGRAVEAATGVALPGNAHVFEIDVGNDDGAGLWRDLERRTRAGEPMGAGRSEGIIFVASRLDGAVLVTLARGGDRAFLAWNEDGSTPLAGDEDEEADRLLGESGLLEAFVRSGDPTAGVARLRLPRALSTLFDGAGYPAAALAMAARDGASLGDVASAVSRHVRAANVALPPPGHEDPDARSRVARVLASGCGAEAVRTPWIDRALLHLASSWVSAGDEALDLSSEIDGLRSAEAEGAGVMDLAVAVLDAPIAELEEFMERVMPPRLAAPSARRRSGLPRRASGRGRSAGTRR